MESGTLIPTGSSAAVPDVDAGWIRAIDKAQKALRDGKADIGVPVLLMYSDHSVYGDSWNKDFNSGDAVLDVEDIRYGSRLSTDVTCVRVFGGLHDLCAFCTRGERAAL